MSHLKAFSSPEYNQVKPKFLFKNLTLGILSGSQKDPILPFHLVLLPQNTARHIQMQSLGPYFAAVSLPYPLLFHDIHLDCASIKNHAPPPKKSSTPATKSSKILLVPVTSPCLAQLPLALDTNDPLSLNEVATSSLRSDTLDPNPGSTTSQPCDLGQLFTSLD